MWRERRPEILLVAALLAGCGSGGVQELTPKAQKSPNIVDPWILGTTDAEHPTPALLWNGNAGFRIGRSGSPKLPDGTLLPAFTQDSYQQGGEEKIIPLKDWFDTRTAAPPFDPKVLRNYRQQVDLRTGVLTTEWVLTDRGRQVQVTRETLLDPSGPPVWGERWVTKVATTAQLTKKADEMILDKWEKTQYIPKDFDGGNPPADDFDSIQKRAEVFWKDFWTTDIEIDGPVEDQQAVRSFLYYLRTAIQPDNTRAVSPTGLSSEQYFGHVFWDADLWVFPALMLLDPERAQTIPAYRIALAKGARENYLNWVKAGRPLGNGESLGNAPAKSGALMFPWESSVTGRETVPGPSRFQHHISATVAFGLEKAAALDLVEAEAVQTIGQGVAAFYLDRATKRPDGNLSLRGTMSPDEHHIGDNDLYTNVLANWTLDRFGPTGGPRFVLPRDEKGFLSYENDRFRGYKQAAAVLTIFPLQFAPAEQEAKAMMERFEPGVIKNGPAMTDSVHATIWARLGESERAYETWRRSWQEFTRHPLMLFSEKRSRDATYFTTGAGGCLQTVLYGFAGIRIDRKAAPGAKWQKPLKQGWVLSIRPNLPPAWKSMTLKGLTVLDKRYNVNIQGDTVTVQEVKESAEGP